MTHSKSWLVCAGCGLVIEGDELTFACPNASADDKIEHILTRKLSDEVEFSSQPLDLSQQSFIRYRDRLHSYQQAMAAGLSDQAFVAMVEELDNKIFEIDRRRFSLTPLEANELLHQELGLDAGAVLIKNETHNVSGSHKARHLFGTLLHLKWRETTESQASPEGRFAIASCGNAALAAAVVAAADAKALDVFIPTDANPIVVRRLESLGASLRVSPRQLGELGDPCYLRFKEVVKEGALPFSCQGTDNALTIEGGATLAYELVDQVKALGRDLERVFVQVGGAALASACALGLEESCERGLIPKLPRFHTVQTRSAFPLVRAYERLAMWIEHKLDGKELTLEPGQDDFGKAFANRYRHASLHLRDSRALRIRDAWGSEAVEAGLTLARARRDLFMWPWEEAPHSVAHGILDDETYDWFTVVLTMLRSGGFPIIVDEEELKHANEIARKSTSIPVDHTGSSGLSGLLALSEADMIRADENIALLFTGVDRDLEQQL